MLKAGRWDAFIRAHLAGRHSGLAALAVAAAAADAAASGAPALVHALARGGTQVCLVVTGP